MISPSKDISHFRKHFLPLLFIIVSVAFVYSNSLKGSFHFDDDQILLRTNLHLSDLSLESLKGTIYFTPARQKIYRPIPCLTLGLNYYLGKESTFGYHIVNIFIHILCTIAVYIFLLKLLSIPDIRPSIAVKYRYEIAVIASFLFALHPLQTNVATYIIQRMTSMAALFYIVSFTGYIQFRLGTLPEQKQTLLKTYFGLFIFFLSAIFAALSKQNTAILPVIILFADYLFFYRLSSENGQRKTRMVYAAAIFFILCALAYGVPKYYFFSINLYQTRDFSLLERLLTETRIIFFYLYLILIPNIRLLNLNHDFSLSASIINPPQTVISILGIIILLLLAYRFRDKNNLISFSIVWYLGNLAIESTFIPLELIFEHRTYLPGVLVFCMMALGGISIGHQLHIKKVMIIFISAMLVLYGNATVLRNGHFSSKFALWLDAVEKSPKSARARVYLGNAYTSFGEHEKGKTEYEKALSLKPDMSEALLNLGKYYMKGKDYTRAELHYKKVLTQYPKTELACISLASLADIYVLKEEYEKAAHFYQAALRKLNFYTPAIHNLGITKIRLGEKKTAENIFKHGIRIDSEYQNFYVSLAKLYAKEKKYPEAISVLKTYLSRNSDSRRVNVLLESIKKKSKIHKQTKEN